MKYVALCLLVSITVASGQSELAQALATNRSDLADAVSSETVNMRFARDTVLQTIPLAKQSGITIKQDAAQAILKFLPSEIPL
jgi:hypothetical protein